MAGLLLELENPGGLYAEERLIAFLILHRVIKNVRKETRN